VICVGEPILYGVQGKKGDACMSETWAVNGADGRNCATTRPVSFPGPPRPRDDSATDLDGPVVAVAKGAVANLRRQTDHMALLGNTWGTLRRAPLILRPKGTCEFGPTWSLIPSEKKRYRESVRSLSAAYLDLYLANEWCSQRLCARTVAPSELPGDSVRPGSEWLADKLQRWVDDKKEQGLARAGPGMRPVIADRSERKGCRTGLHS